MDEYNLDRDQSDYAAALQAYNNSLLKQQKLQADQDKKADDAHDEWATPVEIASGEVLGKPIKTFIKKAGQKFVKKGVSTAEKIITDRAKQAGQRLADNFRPKIPKGSSLEDVKTKFDPTSLDNDSSLRSSFNRLRNLQGKKPLPEKAPTEPTTAEAPKAPTLETGDVPVVSNPTATPAENQQAKEVSIGSEQETADLAPEQQDAVEAILRGEDPSRALFKYRMKTMDVPTATQSAQPVDRAAQTQRFASRQQELGLNADAEEARSASVAQRVAQEEARDVQMGAKQLPTPSGTTTPKAPSAGDKPTSDDMPTDDDVAGLGGTEGGAGAGAGAGEAGAGAAAGAEGGALEGAAAGADAAAAAEGGLNPIADLVALGLGIAGLFGAAHKAPTPKVQFRPVNPSLQHGI